MDPVLVDENWEFELGESGLSVLRNPTKSDGENELVMALEIFSGI